MSYRGEGAILQQQKNKEVSSKWSENDGAIQGRWKGQETTYKRMLIREPLEDSLEEWEPH